jgi:hypothetical protein
MDVIRTGRKGRHLNTVEKYHIYKIIRNNLYMDNRYIDTHTVPYFRQYTSFMTDSSMYTTKKDRKARTVMSDESIQGIHSHLWRAKHKGNT